MGFDGTKMLAGAILYLFVVALPTVHLLFIEEGLDNPILERVAVGALGVLSGMLLFQGLYGGKDPSETQRTMYWGFNPFLFVFALVLFYLAWISNLPSWIGGSIETGVVVFGSGKTIALDNVWERVVMSVITFGAVWALMRAFKTPRTPEERRALKAQRQEQTRLRRERYADRQQQDDRVY